MVVTEYSITGKMSYYICKLVYELRLQEALLMFPGSSKMVTQFIEVAKNAFQYSWNTNLEQIYFQNPIYKKQENCHEFHFQ